MADYIERDAAYDTLTEYYHHRTDTQHEALREALSRVPAADVAPVVRGRWREMDKGYYVCSACNTFITVNYGYKYCPNCGADMREVQDG